MLLHKLQLETSNSTECIVEINGQIHKEIPTHLQWHLALKTGLPTLWPAVLSAAWEIEVVLTPHILCLESCK